MIDDSEALNYFWINRPEEIRRFLESRLHYQKLAEEVAYILEHAVRSAGIEYAAVTCRAKTLESFCEKTQRKQYANPLEEMTDCAGVRIVYLYTSDRPKLEKLIEDSFRILEKFDRSSDADDDRFGYDAVHYLVALSKRSIGARYDNLRSMMCEIQVRSILQDAWAIVAHHLSYKNEADVPQMLRRKLNALAGLFLTADDQFDRLRADRLAYSEIVKKELISDTRSYSLRSRILRL